MKHYTPELARALFEEAGDALFLFDPESDRLIDVNPMAETLTGFPRTELLREPATGLFRFGGEAGVADRGGMQRLKQAAAKSGVFHSQDGYLLRTSKDGHWVPVNITVTRLHIQPRTLALITARDVREQREAHARVQKMEAEQRRVVSSVSDSIWSAEIDAAGHWTYRYFSPVIERITGRPADFFRFGVHVWRGIVHPEDQPRWDRILGRLRAGQPIKEEYRVVWPDGSVRWVRDSVQVTGDPAHKTMRLDGVMADITDARTRKTPWARSATCSAASSTPCPTPSMSRISTVAISSTMRPMAGCWASAPRVRRLARRSSRFSHRSWPRNTTATTSASMRSGRPVISREEHILDMSSAELRERTADLSSKSTLRLPSPVVEAWRWLAITKAPLRNAQGQVIGLVGVGRDITLRKEAEEALSAERNLLRTLMDHLPGHIFIKDISSRFITCNKATLRTLGASCLEDVIGKSDFDFLDRAQAERFFADEQEILRTGKPLLNREEEIDGHDGHHRVLLTTKVPLRDGGGETVGLVGISHDITDRKQTQRERDQLFERRSRPR